MWILYLTALGAGCAMAVQTAINSRLAHGLGDAPLAATLVSFAVGTVAVLLLAWVKTDLGGHLSALPQQPWWKLSGGLLGALLVLTSIVVAPKIGIGNMLFFLIIGQLAAAALIDHFGLIQMPVRAVTPAKLTGLGLMAAGLTVFMFGGHWLDKLK